MRTLFDTNGIFGNQVSLIYMEREFTLKYEGIFKNMMQPLWIGFLLWAILSLVGCARSPVMSFPSEYDVAPMAEPVLADEAIAPSLSARLSGNEAGIELELKESPSENRRQARKIHYDGTIKLLATHPQKVIESAIELANSVGGYIQNLHGFRVVLQIPVKEFHTVYDTILKMGEVLTKSISAKDITDAYFSAELRLKIAINTRKRLLMLLQKAKTEKEKIKLLKEIERITRQIEILQNQMNALKTLADYSTLTLEVTPRKAFSEFIRGDDLKGFGWINQLSPFKRNVALSGSKIQFQAPDGMVQLEEQPFWISESADGVVFWGSQRKNEPRGSSEFWRKSVQQRLMAEFKTITSLAVKSYQIIRLESKTSQPFVYYIGTLADTDKLNVIEIYFPSIEHEKRYKQQIFNSIEKGTL